MSTEELVVGKEVKPPPGAIDVTIHRTHVVGPKDRAASYDFVVRLTVWQRTSPTEQKAHTTVLHKTRGDAEEAKAAYWASIATVNALLSQLGGKS